MANALQTVFADIADAIRGKTGKTDKIAPANMASEIEGITVGGMDTELVKYVTFMSEDGTTELFIKPVVCGDDCKSPVDLDYIEVPVKESTVAEVYSYSGWSLIAGGTADVTALSNVTEDRTVYAAFAASPMYYTVNFYLEEGGYLYESVQVPYGGTANVSETPIKEGCVLMGWVPSNTNITGNTDCYANWEESFDFATDTWERIGLVASSGKASDAYNIGDEKDLDMGTYGTWKVKIAGFNHDDLSSGGKAAMTLVVSEGVANKFRPTWADPDELYNSSTTAHRYVDYMAELVNGLFDYMPTELQSIVKEVAKKYDGNSSYTSVNKTNQKVWLLSMDELGFTLDTTVHSVLGERYELFPVIGSSSNTTEQLIELLPPITTFMSTTGVSYWTRSKWKDSSAHYITYINNKGMVAKLALKSNMSWATDTRFGFCV